jgi:uncharacterized membrane protein YccF (DUF307 family)
VKVTAEGKRTMGAMQAIVVLGLILLAVFKGWWLALGAIVIAAALYQLSCIDAAQCGGSRPK